jgi:hypothetical protein
MAGITPKFDGSDFTREAATVVDRLRDAQQAAINATGVRVLAGLRVALDDKLDNPTAFTLNAFSLFRARGRHADAAIAVKPIQAAYLKYVFHGGMRTDDVIPSKSAKLNRYGNMPRNYTRGAVARGGFWATARSGVRTLFVDNGAGGLEAVAFKVDRTDYKPVMDPVAEARTLVSDILPEEAEKAFAKVFGKD